jgi:O-acetyl-ADP-ribose deacetylase (regulator of RNase III)
MKYIEDGLMDLVRTVQALSIKSIAIPPLGCGLGGLNWAEVRPRIEVAFSVLPDVDVVLYAPLGAPAPAAFVKEKRKPGMTAGRAILILLMEQYLSALMDDSVSLLEVHKLAYFMQIAGEPLKLHFEKASYGPYSTNLRHAISVMDGYYLEGYGDAVDTPTKPITLMLGAAEEAKKWLADHPKTAVRFDRVASLIEGFETPFGMELLASVHWVADQEGAQTATGALQLVHDWIERKRMFSERQVTVAWNALLAQQWLTSASAPSVSTTTSSKPSAVSRG